jgi:hypothetical protein
VSSPATQVRAVLKTALEAEFAAEGITVEDDHLDESLGQNMTRAAIYPLREQEQTSNANVLETEVVVQMFGAYDPQINEEQSVDPAIIEGWAERLRDAFRAVRGINDPVCWYCRVLRTDYPPDPTGNMTRFVMVVRAYGNNSAQV